MQVENGLSQSDCTAGQRNTVVTKGPFDDVMTHSSEKTNVSIRLPKKGLMCTVAGAVAVAVVVAIVAAVGRTFLRSPSVWRMRRIRGCPVLDRHATYFIGKLRPRRCREGTLRSPSVRVVPPLVARYAYPTAPPLCEQEGSSP